MQRKIGRKKIPPYILFAFNCLSLSITYHAKRDTFAGVADENFSLPHQSLGGVKRQASFSIC